MMNNHTTRVFKKNNLYDLLRSWEPLKSRFRTSMSEQFLPYKSLTSGGKKTVEGREKRNKPLTFDHMPVTFWWCWLSDNITVARICLCPFISLLFWKLKLLPKQHLHAVMVYALRHAAILHLGLHSKCKVILWGGEKTSLMMHFIEYELLHKNLLGSSKHPWHLKGFFPSSVGRNCSV